MKKAFSDEIFIKNNKESLLAENQRLKQKIAELERIISSYKGVLTRQKNKRNEYIN